MKRLIFRLKMLVYFGGKQNFIDKVLDLRDDSVRQRGLVCDIRTKLADIRHLDSDNLSVLLEMEETLDNEISALNSIARR